MHDSDSDILCQREMNEWNFVACGIKIGGNLGQNFDGISYVAKNQCTFHGTYPPVFMVVGVVSEQLVLYIKGAKNWKNLFLQ